MSIQTMTSSPMRPQDMHIIRKLFALRAEPGGSNGLVKLYIEDDGVYHHKMTFDRAWLPDLIAVARAGQDAWGLKKE